MFVAGFIGSPSMNFFEGKIIQKEGILFFSEKTTSMGTGQIYVQADEAHARHLANWLDKPLILGLRTEDIEVSVPAGSSNSRKAFQAAIDVIEPMGAETHLYLNSGAHQFVARSQNQLETGSKKAIEMIAHMRKAHYFKVADQAPFKKESGEIDLEQWHTACEAII